MGRYVGVSVNKGKGGGGLGPTVPYSRTTGIRTDSSNNVTKVVLDETTYRDVQYNNVGLITGFNEKIGGATKGWVMEYDSQNLVTNVTERTTAHPLFPEATVTASATALNEGDSVTFTIATANVADSTTLYWGIVGITTVAADMAGDFSTALTGDFTVTSSSGSVLCTTVADGTNDLGNELFKLRIYSDAARTKDIGDSPTVTIADTSSGPPAETPRYTADGASYWINNPSTTWNGVKVRYGYANALSFNASETPTTDDWGPYVTDTSGASDKWYIGANWGGSAVPSRWNSVHGIYTYQKAQSPGGGYSFTFGNANTSGPHTSRFYSVRGSSTQVSGTSAGIVTTNYNDFEFDATEWTNSYGDGFASFYSDSNSSNHKYPDIINTITSNSPNWNPDGHGSGDSDGGMILWKPPKPTKEVMLVYANNHSNDCCNITCWNNNNGSVKWQARYGRPSSFSTGGNTVNENYTRTIIAEHTDGFVYINSDHGGTVAGAFYYMYR